MTWLIWIDSNGGSIGRFHWINTDTRRTCSSWTFWGDWWWDTVGERSLPLPAFWDGDCDKTATPEDQ